ncbi:MAG: DegT/DnrJ/EryC1/StrS family aminotransferase [Bdellovibrionales bacterium]|nr:DegT/DnrJ/EryC1/StrS family aminotransferase [Bdellovibrionales bacterium]
MKVPYSYLPRQFESHDAILSDISKLVKSGDFTLGEPVTEFENRFAKLIGSKYAIGVNSGTDALFLSLKAIDLQPGDEVITAVNTFVATAGAIETAGGRIRFVDCNDTYVIDVNKIEEAITDRTRVIMPVHYSGQPAEMDVILQIAKRHDLTVIEDSCCAIDAEYQSMRCGTIGLTGTFSLHPLKNLNVWGDSGVVTTDSEKVRDTLVLLRNHGMINRDEYAFYAYNSRLDSLQAVVANHLIDDVQWITDKRIEHAHQYDSAFADLSDFIAIPPRRENERHVFHMYMMLVQDRDRLNDYLHENGIESKIHYPIPLHLQKASQHLGYRQGDFPVAEQQAKDIISLPVHQHLTGEEVAYVIEKVRSFYG